MMELNISPVAAVDYKEWLLYKTHEDDGAELGTYIRNLQDAVLLGMWFREWNATYHLPYKLTYAVRHVEESLLPFQEQMKFFGNEFCKQSNSQVELYPYCVYMLENMMMEYKEQVLLAIYLGKQIGNAMELGIEKNLEGSVVFVKTRSGSAFVGIVKSHHGEDIVLINAHELVSKATTLTDIIETCSPLALCSKVMLYDMCELRPCTAEMLYQFVQRTGCQTYGCPQPMTQEEVESEMQNQ